MLSGLTLYPMGVWYIKGVLINMDNCTVASHSIGCRIEGNSSGDGLVSQPLRDWLRSLDLLLNGFSLPSL